MKYGVVIVTYNRLELLKECISNVNSQTKKIDKVIIINNASNDGTKEYLDDFINDERYYIVNSNKNRGGAYGFHEGLKVANELEVDWILLIDDDAILDKSYISNIDRYIYSNREIMAFSGVVMTEGIITTQHRTINRSKFCYKPVDVVEEEYKNPYFLCDYASFCGLMVSKELVKKIGLPLEEYFIWCDDSEYSLRISKHSKIMNINSAILNHKTLLDRKNSIVLWKDYYGIRNRINLVRRHLGIVGVAHICIFSIMGLLSKCLKYYKEENIKEIVELYMRAINDGMRGRLGICKKYLP
jgi:GT2 family glycosyltransferase